MLPQKLAADAVLPGACRTKEAVAAVEVAGGTATEVDTDAAAVRCMDVVVRKV